MSILDPHTHPSHHNRRRPRRGRRPRLVDGGAGVADPGQLKLDILLLFNLTGGGVDCEGAPVKDKNKFILKLFREQ